MNAAFTRGSNTDSARPGRRRSPGAAAWALALALPALPAWSLPEDADQPIEIQAERAEYDQDSATVTYLGNVDVQQGTMRVTADEMTVHYEDQKVVRITAHGGPASYRQMLEPPRGEVEADATVIVYHTQEERVDLRGDAYLSQGGNEMTGDLIHYDIVAGRARAQSGEQGPVRVTVQPDGESEEQP